MKPNGWRWPGPGDRGAMHELYERNRSRIYSLAYRYAGNVADAEDILQDSFIKAFQSLQKCQLDENSYFATWLYRIAVNCALDHFRRRSAAGKARRMERDRGRRWKRRRRHAGRGIPAQRDPPAGAARPGTAQRTQAHGGGAAPLPAAEDRRDRRDHGLQRGQRQEAVVPGPGPVEKASCPRVWENENEMQKNRRVDF